MIRDLPKISIVTPSFNQAEFLEATIHSVLSQNYPNLEYIIVDGGSTDGSIEIIKNHANHLHFWCSEPDTGQYDAINKGFAQASGEIMAWLNSDDMYLPWTFKTVASIMADLPQVQWLTTLRPGFWDWHGFCLDFSSAPGYAKEAFLDGRYLPSGAKPSIEMVGPSSPIQQESTFWRQDLWQKVGSCLNTSMPLAGDFDLWSRFWVHADLYGTISPLGGFRSQFNQRSREFTQYVLDAEQSLADLRASLDWVPSPARRLTFKLSFHKVPKLRSLLANVCGYTGKRVIRRNLDSPNGYWDIEEYQFL